MERNAKLDETLRQRDDIFLKISRLVATIKIDARRIHGAVCASATFLVVEELHAASLPFNRSQRC
jgi:hypothetical protein